MTINNVIAAFLLLLSSQAQALHLNSKQAHVDITTDKIVTLYGVVDSDMEASYAAQTLATAGIPGDRVVLINSIGGYVTNGEHIIQMMEIEKHQGAHMVCVVMGEATSMAFNILTHCDTRLATAASAFTVHKIALSGFPPQIRLTAKALREAATELEAADATFALANRKAMGLSAAAYSRYADSETRWTVKELIEHGYLHGVIKVK